jgi:hypothetical protein
MNRVTQRFWPPQFFSGQRACGCCQPPPPPPPQTGYYGYGYYGGRIVRQTNSCTRLYNGQFYNYCHTSDGSVTSEDPARYWQLEIDSFESVTSESPDDPYGGCGTTPATATTCENANGTFVLAPWTNAAISETLGDRIFDGNIVSVQHIYQTCVWISPVFVGIDKRAVGSHPLDPLGCFVCSEQPMQYSMELNVGVLVRNDTGAVIGSKRTAALYLKSLTFLGEIVHAQWESPVFTDNETNVGNVNFWTNFQCMNNNIMPLVYAQDGYGPRAGEYMSGWPRCCTGAPNAIELVPL